MTHTTHIHIHTWWYLLYFLPTGSSSFKPAGTSTHGNAPSPPGRGVVSASCWHRRTRPGAPLAGSLKKKYLAKIAGFWTWFPKCSCLFGPSAVSQGETTLGVIIAEILGIDADLEVPIDEPNKALCHYLREAGPFPVGTSRCPGTFCSITASSVTTPTLLHQPLALKFFLLSISPSLSTNSTIIVLAFHSCTMGFSLFTPQSEMTE